MFDMEMSLRQLSSIIFISTLLFNSCQGECERGWTHHGNSCYKAFREKMTWVAARGSCRSRNKADLASITSAEENQFAWRMAGRRNTWIGGSSRETEGTFTWSDGTPWENTLWGRGQPSRVGKINDCVQMKRKRNGRWYDIKCTKKRQFICEKHPTDDPQEAVLAALEEVLTTPSEVRGEPFPAISGPSPSDKVCIVGAGPAGLHMALLLKRRGYSHLTILEKTGRVGGMSYDINYRGVANPLGTSFLEPSYFDNFVPLAKEFGADLVSVPSPTPWFTNSEEGMGTLSEYYVRELAHFTNTTDVKTNIGFLLNNIIRYIRLHKELFGDYEGDFMRRPKSDVMHRIRGTFLDFLRREKLEPMKVIFKTTTEIASHAYLDEISALYGLIWNKPIYMSAYAYRILRVPGKRGIYFLKEGFEKVWKNIVEKENLNIEFNTDIYSLTRNNGSSILKIWTGSSTKAINCDFVIWAAPMAGLLRTLTDASDQELKLLRGLKPSMMTASLVNMEEEARNGPYSIFLQSLNSSSPDGAVTGEFSHLGSLTPKDFNNQTLKTTLILQTSRETMSEKDLKSKLRQHYEVGLKAKNVEILHSITWEYFYRWSPQEMEAGRLWEVFSQQGRAGLWYCGSSVSHESIRGVMEYNKLLLANMEVRSDGGQQEQGRPQPYISYSPHNLYQIIE